MSRVFWANKSVFWHFHAFDDLQSYWPYLCHPLSTINAHPHSCSCCLCSHPLQPFFCRCSPEPVCSATAFLFFRCLCLLVDAGSCWVYVFYVIVCCCLDSLESVAMLPIGRECPPSILFSHLFTNSLFRIRPPVQTHTHIQSHTHITHTTSIHLCMFFLAALQQGFACTLGKSESCC